MKLSNILFIVCACFIAYFITLAISIIFDITIHETIEWSFILILAFIVFILETILSMISWFKYIPILTNVFDGILYLFKNIVYALNMIAKFFYL